MLKQKEVLFDKKTELTIFYVCDASSLLTSKNKRFCFNSPHTLIGYGGHT
tara:strand:- start:1345 stop:1494 length:150 start_codon:yes stop_codon:yes gene_type:complete